MVALLGTHAGCTECACQSGRGATGACKSALADLEDLGAGQAQGQTRHTQAQESAHHPGLAARSRMKPRRASACCRQPSSSSPPTDPRGSPEVVRAESRGAQIPPSEAALDDLLRPPEPELEWEHSPRKDRGQAVRLPKAEKRIVAKVNKQQSESYATLAKVLGFATAHSSPRSPVSGGQGKDAYGKGAESGENGDGSKAKDTTSLPSHHLPNGPRPLPPGLDLLFETTPRRTLLVVNASSAGVGAITASALEQVFSAFKGFERVYMAHGKPYSFVLYRSGAEAFQARQALHAKLCPQLRVGKALFLEYVTHRTFAVLCGATPQEGRYGGEMGNEVRKVEADAGGGGIHSPGCRSEMETQPGIESFQLGDHLTPSSSPSSSFLSSSHYSSQEGLPPGIFFYPDFITAQEERKILQSMEEEEKLARSNDPSGRDPKFFRVQGRRVKHYGQAFDYHIKHVSREKSLVALDHLPEWIEDVVGRLSHLSTWTGNQLPGQAQIQDPPPTAPSCPSVSSSSPETMAQLSCTSHPTEMGDVALTDTPPSPAQPTASSRIDPPSQPLLVPTSAPASVPKTYSNSLLSPSPPPLPSPPLPRAGTRPDQMTAQHYAPGTGIGFHADSHTAFEDGIAILSLGTAVMMDFRHPDSATSSQHGPRVSPDLGSKLESGLSLGPGLVPAAVGRARMWPKGHGRARPLAERTSVDLLPRSLLIMRGPARYKWEHAIRPRRSDPAPMLLSPGPGMKMDRHESGKNARDEDSAAADTDEIVADTGEQDEQDQHGGVRVRQDRWSLTFRRVNQSMQCSCKGPLCDADSQMVRTIRAERGST